jgi:hypothetical protein
MQAAQGPHKRFLRNVLGIVTMAEHPIRQTENGRSKAFHELSHRGLFACKTAIDQLKFFVTQHWSSPRQSGRTKGRYRLRSD